MRKGLVLLVSAATLGAAVLATPAMAAGQYYGGGYHQDRGTWDHHDRDGYRGDWRGQRDDSWRWHRHHDGYGYHDGGYGGNYYGDGYYGR